MIPKRAYHDKSIFESEMRALFREQFVFAGLATELSRNRDYLTVDYHGTQLVVQNFKGELRAFQNICTHRFARLQADLRGNRPLLCGYHGWNYNADGVPFAMPKREQFVDDDGAIGPGLCLPSYEVATCGKFVFVREEGQGQGTLADHLGSFWDVLEEVSQHIGAEIHFTDVAHAANWKLLVENVVECYHCATVHTNTFLPLGIGRQPISEVAIDGLHSASHFPRTDQPREGLRQRYLSHLADRGMVHNSFYHIFIFPNLFITSSEGLSFYVGQMLPEAEGRTNLRMRLFEPAVELSDRHRERQVPINQGTVEVSMALIEEDRRILESIQQSLPLAAGRGALGADEVRITAFADAYAAKMAAVETNAPAPSPTYVREGVDG